MKHYKHSYSELAKVARKYYNDTNMCGVIAVAVACNLSYGKAYNQLKRIGRVDRDGTYTHLINMILSNYDKVQHELVQYCGRTINSLDGDVNLKEGVYIIYVRGHVLSMRDGIVEDWTQGRRHKIISLYSVS